MYSYSNIKTYCFTLYLKWQKLAHSPVEKSASFNIESIEVDGERADARKYQTVNRFRKGFEPGLNACKENSGKLIEVDS